MQKKIYPYMAASFSEETLLFITKQKDTATSHFQGAAMPCSILICFRFLQLWYGAASLSALSFINSSDDHTQNFNRIILDVSSKCKLFFTRKTIGIVWDLMNVLRFIRIGEIPEGYSIRTGINFPVLLGMFRIDKHRLFRRPAAGCGSGPYNFRLSFLHIPQGSLFCILILKIIERQNPQIVQHTFICHDQNMAVRAVLSEADAFPVKIQYGVFVIFFIFRIDGCIVFIYLYPCFIICT